MNKITFKLYIVLIALIAIPKNSKAQTEYKLDSIQNFNWDESAGALQMTIRQHYTYDNEGSIFTNHLHMLKTNDDWVNNQQTNNTLNNLGFPSVSTTQSWDTNIDDWINSSRFFNSYTDFNAPESSVGQIWDNYSMIWLYSHKQEYLYNDAQRQTKQSLYLSENNQDIWIPNNEFETVYDEEGRTLGYIQRNYDTNLMQMINESQTVYTIIGDVVTEFLQQDWDTSTNVWVNTFKDEYMYNNDLLEQRNGFTWEADAWEPARQIHYTHNANNQIETSTTLYYFDPAFENYSRLLYTYTNNHLTEWIFQSWDVDHWRNTQKWNDVYDGNDNLTESYRYTWDTDDWKENTKARYFYSEVIPFSLNIASNELLETKIYPNPASEIINVKTLSSIKSIEMYNTLGKLLLTTNENTFKVDTFQNGLYLLKIETDKEQITKRIIIK